MDDFFVNFSGLRANVAQDIKVCGYNYHEYPLGYGGIYREDLDCPGIMLGRGFHNFIFALLRCFYPALRSHRLRCSFEGNSVPHFVYGNGRDKSPLLPRLIATHSETHITFLANAAWIEDRKTDFACFIGAWESCHRDVPASQAGTQKPVEQAGR